MGHWSRRQHREHHRRWEQGIKVPAGLIKTWDIRSESVVTVDEWSPTVAHHKVYTLATLFRDEGGFDSPGWPHWHDIFWYKAKDNATAFVAVREKYAVGLAIVLNKEFRKDHEGSEELFRQPTLARVFVCNNWRRQGIGTQLVQAALAHFSIAAGELYWEPPLSDTGLTLMNHIVRSSETALWWIAENCEWKKQTLVGSQ